MSPDRSIKGTSLAVTLELVRERFGDEGVLAVQTRMPPKERAELPDDMRPLPSSTYAFEVWAELLLAIDAVYGQPKSLVRESSRIGYSKLLRSTYRNWVHPDDVRATLRRLPLLFEQVTRGIGTLEYVERDGRILILGHYDVCQRYRAIVVERVAGTIEAAIEVAGGHGRVDVRGLPDVAEYAISLEGAGAG